MDEFYIRTLPGEAMMVDASDKNGAIWLTISVMRGRVSTVLTKEQARELIAALQQVAA